MKEETRISKFCEHWAYEDYEQEDMEKELSLLIEIAREDEKNKIELKLCSMMAKEEYSIVIQEQILEVLRK